MKKILTLAIILLTLLPATEVSAQNYSSETSLWNMINNAWNNAMDSNADIYTDVYDDSSYKFDDYSKYGDFTQEVLYSDGTRILYGLDPYGNTISNYASESVAYNVGTSYKSDSYYVNSTDLMNHDLIIKSNGNYEQTLRRVTNLLASRTCVTGTETAAVALIDGNYVIFRDRNNTMISAELNNCYSNKDVGCGYYECNGYCFPIKDFYHTHPKVNLKNLNNPLYVSPEDINATNNFYLDRFYIVDKKGTCYEVVNFKIISTNPNRVSYDISNIFY